MLLKLKIKTLAFALLLLLPFVISSQILTDAVSEEEVAKIILNYKLNGYDKFSIKAESSFNGKKNWFGLFIYEFTNDSTLIHNYEEHEATFVLMEDLFVYQETESDIKRREKYLNENYIKTRYSANISIKEYYTIIEKDSILRANEKIIFDSLPNMYITTRFYSNDTLEKIYKKEIIILKNDTIQEIYYVDIGDGMFETNNFKQFTSTQKKGNKELYSTY